MENVVDRIHWLGHASFRIDGDRDLVIYVDPYNITSGKKADLILISHEHFDHFSPKDIEKIKEEKTEIVGPPDSLKDVGGKTTAVQPGENYRVQGIEILTVPAYNTNKSFHPKQNKWVGYIITIAGKRIYFAGDTDRIPEMKKMKTETEIALLPVSGTYVMTAEEAAEAALDLKPEVAIPMHYGSGVAGTSTDGDNFKELLRGRIEVVVKKQEP